MADSLALLRCADRQRFAPLQGIQGHAIGVGNGAGIIRGLHSPLDFKAVDTGVPKICQMLDHAQVFCVQDKGSPAFRDLHVLSRPGLLHKMVFPSAGLGTFAVVGISSRQIIGQQASSREGYAHGAVDEGLDAKCRRTVRTDFADFFHAALPGKHHRIRAELVQERRGFAVQYPQLRADMSCTFRRMTLRHAKQSEIRQDQRVRSQLLQEGEIVRDKRQFLLPGQHIACDICFLTPLMDQTDRLLKLRILKADRLCAHAEQSARKIYGIRPVEQCRMNPIQIPCRGQQFRCLHVSLPVFICRCSFRTDLRCRSVFLRRQNAFLSLCPAFF